jgi:hypothetical protein
MLRRTLIISSRCLVGLFAVGYLLIHVGISPAKAALTTQQVNQFLADPTALLTQNPNGGGKLVTQVRDLMLSEPCTPSPTAPRSAACQQALASIIGLLANSTDAQKTAIGTGLADAAQLMVPTNPTLAADIQTALATNGDKLALEAYQTTVGNQAIGSAGGGGGGTANAAYETLTNTGGGGGGGLTTSAGTGTTSFGLTSGGSVSGSTGSGTTTVLQTTVSTQ